MNIDFKELAKHLLDEERCRVCDCYNAHDVVCPFPLLDTLEYVVLGPEGLELEGTGKTLDDAVDAYVANTMKLPLFRPWGERVFLRLPALNEGILPTVRAAWAAKEEEVRRAKQEKERRLTEIEMQRHTATRSLEMKRERYTPEGFLAEMREINEAYRVEKAKYET